MSFNITYKSKRDLTDSEKKFDVKLYDWTSQHISLIFDFNEPLVLSSGVDKDILELQILNKDIFVASKSLKILNQNQTKIETTIETQLPKGISEAFILERAETDK
jgi:hypothetical protein